ncbi:MAG: hypothetical protein KGN34_17455 [Sphingomonadales bacterium]|nr:hypothetical protein [Sphingomonadales bacterium]
MAASLAGSQAGPAFAAPAVSVDSAVFVERVKLRDGAAVRSLEPASRLVRGDRVVTVVNWYRLGGNGGFVVTNALPNGLAYQASGEPSEEVSVDGGRTWGQLGALRVGGRVATPEDVTHVRWRVSPNQAMVGAGRIAYAGFVR